MSPAARRARLWFRGAAAYGVAVLLPLFVAEPILASAGRADLLPPFGRGPDFYGFVGAALAWQLVYWTIGGDPGRFRPLMPLAVAAKLSFFLPVLVLFPIGRADALTLALASVDALLAAGFLLAWRATRPG